MKSRKIKNKKIKIFKYNKTILKKNKKKQK